MRRSDLYGCLPAGTDAMVVELKRGGAIMPKEPDVTPEAKKEPYVTPEILSEEVSPLAFGGGCGCGGGSWY